MISHSKSVQKSKTHPGCPCLMNVIKNNLCYSIFKLHQQELQANMYTVKKEALQLSLDFKYMITAKIKYVQ